MWVTAQDLTQVSGMPQTTQGVAKKARSENWEKRKAQGIKGGAYEYNVFSLSIPDQAQVLKKYNKINVNGMLLDRPKPKEKNYCPEALWAKFDKISNKQKDLAKFRCEVVIAAKALIDNRVQVMTAFKTVAETYDCSRGNVQRWYYDAIKFEREDWLAVLVSDNATGKRPTNKAEFTPEAKEFLYSDYLRLEKPALKICYRRLQAAAKEHGWIIPSLSAVRRTVETEISIEQLTLLREGEHALMQLYPAQQRTVAHLQAMEWVNGDGYQHNVFVKWYNGEVLRPKTWIWQDVLTRKILAYRCDVSENSDSIRLSFADVVQKYGIPKHMTIDNTRAAASKSLTGGQKTRYRNQILDDDQNGVFTLLGIQIHWTSVNFGKGHGQAKPIERAFSHGGLEEMVDKDPRLAGFYTGSGPKDKPANYDSKKGVDVETFLEVLEYGIHLYNSRPNRQTEICQGKLSFNEAFEERYKVAKIKKATQEQYRLLLLPSEVLTVKKDGTFELKAGGSIDGAKNRYYNEQLVNLRVKKVVARYDSQNLHGDVLVYSLDGHFICQATCLDARAYDDVQSGRESSRLRKQLNKRTKAEVKAINRLADLKRNTLMPKVPSDPVPEATIIEPLISPLAVVNGDSSTPVSSEPDFNFDDAFAKGLNIMKAEKERGY